MIDSSKLSPTQLEIINCDNNVVVLACPGSGKSTTMAFKIARHLHELKDHQGIIAISYTNKASDELKEKVLSLNSNISQSFFGTIDKFCITQIIIPATIKNNIEPTILLDDDLLIEGKTQEEVKKMSIDELLDYQKAQILDGKIFMKTIDIFSKYLLENNLVLRDYLIAKYKMIFIDEYQDCSCNQNWIFEFLVGIGLKGVAVGDPAQSIFEYAGKSSKHLIDLSNNKSFSVFYLDVNHRCHQSIINYSMKFLSSQFNVIQTNEIRVGRCLIDGNEIDIANYIDTNINNILGKYKIENLSKIAILTRSRRTAALISDNLQTENIVFDDTKLEILARNSIDAQLGINVLKYCFSSNSNLIAEDIISNHSKILRSQEQINAIKLLNEAKVSKKETDIIKAIEKILKRSLNAEVRNEIINTLKCPNILNNLLAINNDKVNIMTIHKSKGLEFDFVIVLDLYKFVLPAIDQKSGAYLNLNEDRNLHYVSLTRAKKSVLIICSAKRTNSKNKIVDATPSEFITYPFLDNLKKGNL